MGFPNNVLCEQVSDCNILLCWFTLVISTFLSQTFKECGECVRPNPFDKRKDGILDGRARHSILGLDSAFPTEARNPGNWVTPDLSQRGGGEGR